MGNSAVSITKGKMFQGTDELLATPPPGKTLAQWYEQLRQDLVTGGDSMSALATEVGVISGQAAIEHVDDEALGNGPNAFFRSIPKKEKEQILREGFIKAYDLALVKTPTRPIVTFWLAIHEADAFEVLIAASPSQITLYWITGVPPGWGQCEGRVEEELYLVASHARVGQIRGRFQRPERLVIRAAGAEEHPARQSAVQVIQLRGD